MRRKLNFRIVRSTNNSKDNRWNHNLRIGQRWRSWDKTFDKKNMLALANLYEMGEKWIEDYILGQSNQ